jgi:hypothetical protein
MQLQSASALATIASVSGTYFNTHYSMLVGSLTLELGSASKGCTSLNEAIQTETDEDNLEQLKIGIFKNINLSNISKICNLSNISNLSI